MAIYHNSTQVIGRQGRDKAKNVIPGKQISMLAKAAYRSGDRLTDVRTDKTYDYRSREQDIVQTGILAPEGSPVWLVTNEAKDGEERREQAVLREKFWNAIEAVEKRKDSQLAREFELALPIELSEKQRVNLLRDWCQSELVSKGFVVDYAIHRSKDEGNPHAHVLVTMRPVDADSPSGFGKKPDMSGKFNGRGLVGAGAKADLMDWRETWADAQNKALEAAQVEARVDHRSLEEQGIDRTPQTHKGVTAVAMERKGFRTMRGVASRAITYVNQVKDVIADFISYGEVPQYGVGETWWERLIDAAVEGVETTLGAVMSMFRDDRADSWVDREDSRRADPDGQDFEMT